MAPQRSSTGDAELDELIDRIVERSGSQHPTVATDLLTAATTMIAGDTDRLDLKITSTAVAELGAAFDMFQPHRSRHKVTVFGSARTQPDDPLFELAVDVGRRFAEAGWMVVTGAGPGIMLAANQGAGRDMSFGVDLALPFEVEPNPVLHGDSKLVEMRYFFTRKLMLMKESQGFVALPGGLGTQDETFELLTLQQTGKAEPTPVVLLDAPGGTYWTHWVDYVKAELEARGMIHESDHELYIVTDDPAAAVTEIGAFWSNHHSIRYVGDRLVMRMQRPVTDHALDEINERFGHLVNEGKIVRSRPYRPEVETDDHLDLHRLSFRYSRRHYGRLEPLIRAINAGASAE